MNDNKTWKHSVKQRSGESREEYLERLLVVAEIRGALFNMMDRYFLLSIGDLNIQFPSIHVDDEVIAWVRHEVSRLQSERTLEASGSIIHVPNSIHRFWGSLLSKLRRADRAMSTRIVYEWGILHPFSGKAEAIDFTFIPCTQSHCNWINFMGGLELKNNPQPSSTGASPHAGGLMAWDASDGLAQALRRCALSVYMKWRATGFSGTHCAFCCFADARKFGVVRVRVDEKDVVAQKWGPVNLPGYPSSATPDISSLKFLSFVLNSHPEALIDLVSPAPIVADLLEGREEGVGDSEWRLGAFLGKGGFATVFADANDPYRSVIKLSNADMLQAECRALTMLSNLYPTGTGNLFPALCGRMIDRSTSLATIAVRLSPRGIPLPVYLAAVDCDSSILTMLARRLGAYILTLLRAAHVVLPRDVDVSSTQTADSSSDGNKDVSVISRAGMSCRHGIAHCDVRLPNILMMPPEGALKNVVDAGDDIVSGRAALMEIPLDQCTFLLNDWGNAKVLNVSNRTLHSVEDLLGLVRVLEALGWALGKSIASAKREEPLSKIMREGSPVLAAETVLQLQSAANSMNYDELQRLISDLSFAKQSHCECFECHQSLPLLSFSRNQLNKFQHGHSDKLSCVECIGKRLQTAQKSEPDPLKEQTKPEKGLSNGSISISKKLQKQDPSLHYFDNPYSAPLIIDAKKYFTLVFKKNIIIYLQNKVNWRTHAKLPIRATVDKNTQKLVTKIGLFKPNSHDILECYDHIAHHPQINKALQLLKQCLTLHKIHGYMEGQDHDEEQVNKQKTYMKYVVLTVDRHSQGIQMTLVLNIQSTNSTAQPMLIKLKDSLLALCSDKRFSMSFHSIWCNYHVSGKHDNSILGRIRDNYHLIYGNEFILENLALYPADSLYSSMRLHIVPFVFRQANLDAFIHIIQKIRQHMSSYFAIEEDKPILRCLELYGGIGTIGLHLLDMMYLLHCSDENPNNQKCFEASLSLLTSGLIDLSQVKYMPFSAENMVSNIEVRDGIVGDNMGEYYNVIVVDPPRKGLDTKVIDALLECPEYNPRKRKFHAERTNLNKVGRKQILYYISCGFEALKRDLQALTQHPISSEYLKDIQNSRSTSHLSSQSQETNRKTWTIVKVSGFILFPGADHLETLVILERDV